MFQKGLIDSIHFLIGKGIASTSACFKVHRVNISVKCTVKMSACCGNLTICLDHVSVGNLLLPP